MYNEIKIPIALIIGVSSGLAWMYGLEGSVIAFIVAYLIIK